MKMYVLKLTVNGKDEGYYASSSMGCLNNLAEICCRGKNGEQLYIQIAKLYTSDKSAKAMKTRLMKKIANNSLWWVSKENYNVEIKEVYPEDMADAVKRLQKELQK